MKLKINIMRWINNGDDDDWANERMNNNDKWEKVVVEEEDACGVCNITVMFSLLDVISAWWLEMARRLPDTQLDGDRISPSKIW